MLQKLLFIFAAGGLGSLARYGLAGLVQWWAGLSFPWGTLAVNVLGCFLFGVVWILGAERQLFSAETRTILLVGFMGGFTTFSSFAFETGHMLREADWWLAAANIAAQNVLGILALFLGFAVGRLF